MKTIHLDRLRPGQPSQNAVGAHSHRMPRRLLRFTMVVVKHRRGNDRWNVLNQSAASENVETLRAKTDSQHGQAGTLRVVQKGEIDRVTFRNASCRAAREAFPQSARDRCRSNCPAGEYRRGLPGIHSAVQQGQTSGSSPAAPRPTTRVPGSAGSSRFCVHLEIEWVFRSRVFSFSKAVMISSRTRAVSSLGVYPREGIGVPKDHFHRAAPDMIRLRHEYSPGSADCHRNNLRVGLSCENESTAFEALEAAIQARCSFRKKHEGGPGSEPFARATK